MKVDILMATDLRFPGGNNASVVEEVRAQSRAGYRTALLHLPSPVQRSDRAYAPRIRNLIESNQAQLVLNENVRAKLLVIRHPTVLMDLPDRLPQISVDHVLIIANQVPVDRRARAPYYDVLGCDEAARRLTGKTPQWAPIGPQVRKALLPYSRDIEIRASDWKNIIDVEAWYTPREAFVAQPPVIGRHSRGDWSKWPATRETLTAAYPADGAYSVRVLGGVEAPVEILGDLPSNWVDLPFNSVSPAQFLKGIDFLVYYHHPGLVEAFGRTILEGIAAGAVAIVDPIFQETFGEACRYATIDRAREELDTFSADFDLYKEQSERGVAYVREHFSYASHVRRVEEIIGPSQGELPNSKTVGAPAEALRPPRILVDLSDDFHQWDDIGDNTIVVVPESRGEDLPEGMPVEYIPAHAFEAGDRGVAYTIARVRGLSDVFDQAPVLDTGARLGDISLRAPLYHLRRGETAWQPGGGERIPGWTIEARSRSTRPPRPRLGARGVALLRQRAPQWFVNVASNVKASPRRVRRKLLDAVAPAGAILIRRGGFRRIPVHNHGFSLFIASGTDGGEMQTARLIAERAAMANAFSPGLLAPVAWRDAAECYGIPLETYMSRSIVERLGGSWRAYRQQRITEAVEVFQPISIGLLGNTTNQEVTDYALDSAESLGLRRSEKES